jgi:magnesium-transporting ATPase (P-type)
VFPGGIATDASTIVFLGIVVMQVGNAFACRTERVSVFRIGIFGNRFLLWGVAFELAFAAALSTSRSCSGCSGPGRSTRCGGCTCSRSFR